MNSPKEITEISGVALADVMYAVRFLLDATDPITEDTPLPFGTVAGILTFGVLLRLGYARDHSIAVIRRFLPFLDELTENSRPSVKYMLSVHDGRFAVWSDVVAYDMHTNCDVQPSDLPVPTIMTCVAIQRLVQKTFANSRRLDPEEVGRESDGSSRCSVPASVAELS